MKNYCFIGLVALFFISCTTKKNEDYTKEIKLFQYELNTQFADAKESPLTEQDLITFKGLYFFEIDNKYRIEADFELTPDTKIFEMKTTTERLPLYRKYGIARFTLDGKNFELSVFQNQQLINDPEYFNHLFFPYRDSSNGNESYGGGRYIDLEIPTDGINTIVIDFNKSYNPYCAYNSKYSCPIPPKENNLGIKILAGVKAYKDHH
ncbi:DUF1684 domain-containing protein [Lutibacter sp.]|uniref:DUF1684 domain-containing protein n=1 Tax=Lutibacter sp. TaxID=1925666 RepID=UPI002733024B|nr:DUF1684 domain-containing protein [Lutibacter sp.]MDP3314425.1 DUF1684 domain-containing protein [Lutibacter sp.]